MNLNSNLVFSKSMNLNLAFFKVNEFEFSFFKVNEFENYKKNEWIQPWTNSSRFDVIKPILTEL